ncbi:cobalt-precorrin-6A reductase [Myxacorys almedinensis]|uniref:Cobalt-precorrin-6A reductase n=1 Tax=Myxacorys almedinensis A TaxID=2690445 RepID=A0A8J7Z728_9CYAN|nr:cobalt-precorrin-6A reductase [Myxacorys almedinensis]NDJ19106.1 cobalt-precorrin-6A reductase [Myxacorys almedinensis A]
MKRIWLIGGTEESATLARAIAALQFPCVVSVTTESATSLYPIAPSIQVWVGKLDPNELPRFIKKYNIGVVLDASHPFAVEISKNVIRVTQDADAVNPHPVAYLRFERPTLTTDETGVWSIESFEKLLETDWLRGQRVLLTIGYRFLSLFKPWQDKAMLFTRILPSQVAVEAAIEAGFSSDRIIALRPPISYELERSLWRQWQISTVITKASGSPGGEDVKRNVAKELGVKLIVVERPAIAYPQVTNSVTEAIAFLSRIINDRSARIQE